MVKKELDKVVWISIFLLIIVLFFAISISNKASDKNVKVDFEDKLASDTVEITADVSEEEGVSVLTPSGMIVASAIDLITGEAVSEIEKVEFKIDGIIIGDPITQAPYSIQWDTTKFSNGEHEITAVVTYKSGNKESSSPVKVTVDNAVVVPNPSPSPTTGNIYYVSTTGNDANTCDQAKNINTPKKTIVAGVACLAAGSRLEIRGGTYSESLLSYHDTIPSGTSWTNAVTITRYQNEQVIMQPPSTEAIGFAGEAGKRYIIFDGIIMDGSKLQCNPSPTGICSSGIVYVGNGNDHIRFINGEFRNAPGGFGGGGTFSEFINMKVYNLGIGQYDQALYITGQDILVENSEIYNNAAYGIHVFNSGGGPQRATIRNNIVHDNKLGAGILVGSGAGHVVYNNIVYNNNRGIELAWGGGCDNCKIYNNIVYNDEIIIDPESSQSENAEIKNNIVVGGGIIDKGINTILSNNLCSTSGTGCSVVGDPKFVNAAANNFHLQSTSPAIDKGATLGSPYNVDFDGKTRPIGSAYDIGAYEYGTGTTPTTTGNTYYVATTGNDGNPGTITQPFKTIQKAVDLTKPGDTVYVREGIYNIGFSFRNSGLSGSPITVRNYPGEKPIIENGGVGFGFERTGSIGWNVLEGFEIRNVPGIPTNYNQGVYLNNAHDIIIRGNYIHDNYGQGILGQGYNVRIEGNTIARNGLKDPTLPDNLVHGIYSTGTSFTIVNNIFYGNQAFGVQVAGYPWDPNDPDRPPGPEYMGADKWIISNNIFAYQQNRGGMVVWQGGATNSRIENNIFYNNAVLVDAIQGIEFASAGSGHVLKNNLFYSSAGRLAIGGTGTYTESGRIVADPNFVNPSINDFHLQSTSPAIDKGVTLTEVTKDFDGKTRPIGSAWDIGAYEYGTGTTTTTTGNTYYVATTGADSNPGTSVLPWKTFTFAIPKLKPGDTLVLKDGTYNAGNSGYPNIQCGTNAQSGTASKPITLKAENERKAFLKTDGTVYAIRVANCQYWQFEGLRMEGMDNPSAGAEIMIVSQSDYLTIRRNIFRFNNRYFNVHLLTFYLGSESGHLIEENEFYDFHRHALDGSPINNAIIRRNYCNSHNRADIPGGYGPSGPTTSGDGCITLYPGANNLLENNIAENTGVIVEIDATGPSNNNKIFGNIALNTGGAMTARGTTINSMPRDTLFKDHASIDHRSYGIYARSSKNTRCDSCTFIGNSASAGGIAADQNGDPAYSGDGSYSFFGDNILTIGHTGGYGINIVTNKGSWIYGFDYANSFNNAIAFSPSGSDQYITNEKNIDPQLGSCKVWIPDNSPMKRVGKDVNGDGIREDIGANILYRYENGILTNKPLWDKTTGQFPCGAIIPGVNDIAGSSCFDVNKRLNVNTNGCSFPAGY